MTSGPRRRRSTRRRWAPALVAKPGFRDGAGVEHRLLLLTSAFAGTPRHAGIAVLVEGEQSRHPARGAELVATMSAHLLEAGDARGVHAEVLPCAVTTPSALDHVGPRSLVEDATPLDLGGFLERHADVGICSPCASWTTTRIWSWVSRRAPPPPGAGAPEPIRDRTALQKSSCASRSGPDKARREVLRSRCGELLEKDRYFAVPIRKRADSDAFMGRPSPGRAHATGTARAAALEHLEVPRLVRGRATRRSARVRRGEHRQ